RRSSYARVLIEINASNDFSDNLVMVVPNIEGNGYTKETINIEYEWETPRWGDDEEFIKVKCRKSSGNNGDKKHFKSVSVKLKTQYQPKAKQSTAWTTSYAVATGSKVTTSGMQEREQCSTPIVERINVIENILEDKLVLVDDDENPLEKVGYGPKSLWEQWMETTMDDEYDPYDDDMYESQEILENIQTICDNFDIKVCGRKKK
ncbi:hypothetical protein Tco_0261796, partial [Tanacetum coccineum]